MATTIVAVTEMGAAVEIDNERGIITQLTQTEALYIEQGYLLPEGWTWDIVHQQRKMYDLPAVADPIASCPGANGWGVPFINGRALKHEPSAATQM